VLVGRPVGGSGGGGLGRSEAVTGDGPAGNRLVHLLLLLLLWQEVGGHLSSLPPAAPTTTAPTVTVLKVQLLMVNCLEYLREEKL
jgi:hypothetical protein